MGQTRGQFWKLAITHPSSIEWHGGGLLASLRPEDSESPGLALPAGVQLLGLSWDHL